MEIPRVRASTEPCLPDLLKYLAIRRQQNFIDHWRKSTWNRQQCLLILPVLSVERPRKINSYTRQRWIDQALPVCHSRILISLLDNDMKLVLNIYSKSYAGARMDVAETASYHVLTLEIPGANIVDIKVEVDDKKYGFIPL